MGANSKSAERTGGHSGKAVLWLGTSDAPLALVTHLRSRGIALATPTTADPPVARLMLVEAAVSPAARNASVKGRRVAVIHPDPGSADALAQALRGRGAQVVALSLNPDSLERVEALDPDAVLMEVTDFYGSCWEIVRALWLHPRLKYAPVLLATPEGVASYAQGTPDVPSLCLAVQTVSEAYERVERSAESDEAFALELAHLGPAKLLRVLTESSRGFRVSLQCPVADFEIDVAEGIIVGAQGSAKGAANDLYLGVHALALLMTQERGDVRVRVADHPAATNVMAPLDAALHAAREAKAAPPQDAAATREVASRMSIPSPAPAKATILGAPAAKKPAAFEPSRPAKRAEAAKPAVKAKPAEATKVEPSEVAEPVRASEPRAPAREPAQPAHQPVSEDAKPASAEGGSEPVSSSVLAQPRKTLQGLPLPRRTTSTGRVMAVVPREGGEARTPGREPSESSEPSPARIAAQTPRTTHAAVAQARALINNAASAPVVQGEANANAVLSMRPAALLEPENLGQDLPGEDSRVTSASGVARKPSRAESELERSTIQETDRMSAMSADQGGAVLIRLERWHLWAAFGGLSAAALAMLGLLMFWPKASQEIAPLPPPVPALPLPAAAPSVVAAALSGPAAAPSERREAERPRADATGTSAESPADGPEGDAEEEDSSSAEGDLSSKPPSRQASALVSRGHDLRKRRQYTQAKARYQEALALLPGYPRALAGLVQVSIAQNKGKDAVDYALKLVQARPGQGPYQLLLGDAYKAANMAKEAQQAWQAAARSGSSVAKTRLKSTAPAAAAAPATAGKGSATPATAKGPAPAKSTPATTTSVR